MVVQFIVFLTLSTLICRSTDISKSFSESLGIRDNGSRLYIVRRITSMLCALFTLYAFSNQFSLIKVTINKQVVLRVKWFHLYKN